MTSPKPSLPTDRDMTHSRSTPMGSTARMVFRRSLLHAISRLDLKGKILPQSCHSENFRNACINHTHVDTYRTSYLLNRSVVQNRPPQVPAAQTPCRQNPIDQLHIPRNKPCPRTQAPSPSFPFYLHQSLPRLRPHIQASSVLFDRKELDPSRSSLMYETGLCADPVIRLTRCLGS